MIEYWLWKCIRHSNWQKRQVGTVSETSTTPEAFKYMWNSESCVLLILFLILILNQPLDSTEPVTAYQCCIKYDDVMGTRCIGIKLLDISSYCFISRLLWVWQKEKKIIYFINTWNCLRSNQTAVFHFYCILTVLLPPTSWPWNKANPSIPFMWKK